MPGLLPPKKKPRVYAPGAFLKIELTLTLMQIMTPRAINTRQYNGRFHERGLMH